MRLINADELNETISEEVCRKFVRWDKTITVAEFETFVRGIIDNAPTVYDTINLYPNGAVIIQQTIPQGEWKTVEGYDGDEYYECSNCGEPWVLYAGTPETNNMNFCPNCGADMRKGGAE